MHFLPRITKRRVTIATFAFVLTYACVHAAHRVYYGYESYLSAFIDASLMMLVYFINLGFVIMTTKSAELFDRRRARAIKSVDEANDQFLGLQERLNAQRIEAMRKITEHAKAMGKRYGLDEGEGWKG